MDGNSSRSGFRRLHDACSCGGYFFCSANAEDIEVAGGEERGWVNTTKICYLYKNTVMKTTPQFIDVVESVYNLPLEDREELKSLLEHNIADARRDEILLSYKQAQAEHRAGKLKFSDDIDALMQMLE